MKNQIYRIQVTPTEGSSMDLEFYIADTNDTNPYREMLCLGVTQVQGDFDAALDEDELESLIDYLQNCQRAIKQFNKDSKPREVQE